MTTINLKNGYYIEVDSLNHTLKQRFQGKTKTGETKDSDRTCGYFPSMRGAIEKYIKLCRLDVLDGEYMEMQEYIRQVERIDQLALHGIEKIAREI